MKSKRSDEPVTRTIKTFSDILILKYIKHNPKSSGYEILKHLHEKYNIFFSPGTLYHEIYFLERNGEIKSDGDESGRAYSLTAEGEKNLSEMIRKSNEIQSLIANIFSD